MKLPNIKGLVQVGKVFVQTRRPELLLGAAITSTIGSVILAAKGGYEAGQMVMKAEFSDLDLESEEAKTTPLNTKEKVQLTWLCYMPAAITTVGAIGSTTGLHIVHVKDKKALAATALAAIEEVKASAGDYVKEVEEAVKENTTEKAQEKIRNSYMEKSADEHGVARVMNTDGEIEELYLVRDGKTGRDIWSNRHRIEDALIEINNVLNGSGDCELNHFYQHAGFGQIPDGGKVGWSGALVELEWDTTTRDDGRPVRRFSFRPEPTTGYDDPHA